MSTITTKSAQKSRARVALWRTATAATRTIARPTAGLRADPGFLIAGAQRAGTTSLHRYLMQHPAILSARLTKGVHYFDAHYEESHDWYRSHFPTRAKLRRLSARLGVPALTGEGSPYYMFHPAIPQRIASMLPHVKLLVILRDPVSRAWSHYHHEVARGFEDLPFEQALDAEAARLAGEDARLRSDPRYRSFSHQHHSYIARGRYVDQITRLHHHFGHERVHVIESGAFKADPQTACDGVADFLGLPRWRLDSVVHRNARSYDRMGAPERELLGNHFHQDNERLFRYLDTRWAWTGPSTPSGDNNDSA